MSVILSIMCGREKTRVEEEEKKTGIIREEREKIYV
jgi:hypothetical protein